MKTLIASALIATAALAGAASAQVPAGAAGAIAHFNQDFSTQDQRIAFTGKGGNVTVSTRNGTQGAAIEQFNATVDSPSDRISVGNATLVSGQPSVAQDIFARILEEGRDDD
ncbi:MAG: hypothetical protein AAFY65_17510 [Pseudomonadota bacterium]